MLTLLTKDGRKTGNAIIYGTVCDHNTFLIETDFGNKMELTLREVDELFYIGEKADYNRWKQDRYDKVSEAFRVKVKEDGDVCNECGNVIPIVSGGGLINKHHKESCSLFDKDKP